jgi:uncharacterized membrane protein
MTSTRPTFSRHLRNLFLRGFVVVVPIVITVNALVWLFRFVDGLAGPRFEALLGRAVPGGDVVVLPATDVIETDLSVEDGVSLMLSAGASVPRVVSER